ncbi:transposase, partial [Acidomonas methanolica]|uniref:transposase n=1 Tax=Acidomonas methanolica TaxID=437 RepID=UPI0011DDEAE1
SCPVAGNPGQWINDRSPLWQLKSEASFAALCGVTSVPASSGKTVRHRLNRGGDRAANSALHLIAIGRLRTDEKTRAYVARRIAEGHSKLEVIRI